MEEKRESGAALCTAEGIVSRCVICGKSWDEDGCRVSVVSGVSYEIEEFVCGNCQREEE